MERKYTYLLTAFEFFQKMLDMKHTDYGAPITFFNSEKATSRSQISRNFCLYLATEVYV